MSAEIRAGALGQIALSRRLQAPTHPADSALAMTSKDAITAHVNWKLRIYALLSGKSSEKLDAAAIGRDNVCELGKRLVHAELMSVHAHFHREAGRIVGEVNAGRSPGLEAIAPDSAFGKLTTRVVAVLSKTSAGPA